MNEINGKRHVFSRISELLMDIWVTRKSSESFLNVRLRSRNANMALIIVKLPLLSRILGMLMEIWVTRKSSESCMNVRLESLNTHLDPITTIQSLFAKFLQILHKLRILKMNIG